jgi:hypothetical protein
MAVYFFDSSALVKRHVDESGSAWVRSLTRVKAGHTLYIARITAVEITSAITRRQRGRHLSAAQAGAMLGHFPDRREELRAFPGLGVPSRRQAEPAHYGGRLGRAGNQLGTLPRGLAPVPERSVYPFIRHTCGLERSIEPLASG